MISEKAFLEVELARHQCAAQGMDLTSEFQRLTGVEGHPLVMEIGFRAPGRAFRPASGGFVHAAEAQQSRLKQLRRSDRWDESF